MLTLEREWDRRVKQWHSHVTSAAAFGQVLDELIRLSSPLPPDACVDLGGMISREEFVAGLGPDIADRTGFDAAVRGLLQVADADGNGVLDTGDYTRLAAVYGTGADEAGRAFARLDQDRNGVLDVAELTAAISRFFACRNPGAHGDVAFGHV